MCMRCQLWCILRSVAAPRHSNLSWWEKICFYWLGNQRCVRFARLRHPLSAVCMYVSCNVSSGLVRHPDSRTCCDAKNLYLLNNFGSRGGFDWNIFGNVSSGLVRHPDSRTCCDAKNWYLLNNFGSRGGFDWNIFDFLSLPCACDVSCDVSWGRLRHLDIRTCCD